MRVQPLQTRLISALAELLAVRPDGAAQPEAFIRAIAELPLQERIAQTRVSSGSKLSSRVLLGMLIARLKLPAGLRAGDGTRRREAPPPVVTEARDMEFEVGN